MENRFHRLLPELALPAAGRLTAGAHHTKQSGFGRHLAGPALADVVGVAAYRLVKCVIARIGAIIILRDMCGFRRMREVEAGAADGKIAG